MCFIPTICEELSQIVGMNADEPECQLTELDGDPSYYNMISI